jgi:hypothetical protein
MVRYNWIDNLPVGQHQIKNCLAGLAFIGCSGRFLMMDPEPAKLPNELWRRATEIATAIAATIVDKTIKTIF